MTTEVAAVRTALPAAAADLDLLLLIRHFELTLLDLFAAGHIAGTTHTCIGQEYVPVSLQPLIGDAFVFSNHRGHGHYLARFGDPAGLLAEITGREGAVCHGVGGSQHVYRDGFCSTGVQGESVALALGVALHLRSTGQRRLAVAYIGDGTWGEGAVYEALNMASLWRAPLLVVVENNGIAQSTPISANMAGSIAARAAAFDVRHSLVGSSDVDEIRAQLRDEVTTTRRGDGPLVVEFRTDRVGPHSKGDDSRPPAEIAAIRARDWYARYASVAPERFAVADARWRREMERLAGEVLARPLVGGRR